MKQLMDWLFTEREAPVRAEVQARMDRHDELSRVRYRLLKELKREPTHSEIWEAAS